jgi:hypothetical protein
MPNHSMAWNGLLPLLFVCRWESGMGMGLYVLVCSFACRVGSRRVVRGWKENGVWEVWGVSCWLSVNLWEGEEGEWWGAERLGSKPWLSAVGVSVCSLQSAYKICGLLESAECFPATREIKLCGPLKLLCEKRLLLIIFVGNNTRSYLR